jgi:hypothetical protein
VDIDDVNAKQKKNNSKLTKTIVEKISVKKKKLSIRTLGKLYNSKESQFPSIVKPFKSENNLENCNLFLKG